MMLCLRFISRGGLPRDEGQTGSHMRSRGLAGHRLRTPRELRMKRFMVGLVGLLAVIAMSMPAFAQDGATKVKEINFEDDMIEGELQMPNQTNIRGQDTDDLSSLIKAREDFVDEMLKSVEDL